MRVTLEKNGRMENLWLPASEMDIRKLRKSLHVTDPADNTFLVKSIDADCPAEEYLSGGEYDLDFLNLLARCYNGLDRYEADKFNAVAGSRNITDLTELINLTQNVHRFTLIQPKDTLEEIGRHSFFDVRFAVPAEEAKRVD